MRKSKLKFFLIIRKWNTVIPLLLPLQAATTNEFHWFMISNSLHKECTNLILMDCYRKAWKRSQLVSIISHGLLLKNTGKQRGDKLQIENRGKQSGAGESGTAVSGGSVEEGSWLLLRKRGKGTEQMRFLFFLIKKLLIQFLISTLKYWFATCQSSKHINGVNG